MTQQLQAMLSAANAAKLSAEEAVTNERTAEENERKEAETVKRHEERELQLAQQDLKDKNERLEKENRLAKLGLGSLNRCIKVSTRFYTVGKEQADTQNRDAFLKLYEDLLLIGDDSCFNQGLTSHQATLTKSK